MIKFILFVFIFLYSCNYPDIDNMPDFNSLNISMDEAIDKCKMTNIYKVNKDNCFIEYEYIINRL